MSLPLRVAVAGAGVFGLASALRLARAGAVVTLHDPGLARPNASAVAAGMLAPVSEALTDPTAAPHLDLLLAAQDYWPGFAEAYGLRLDQSGAILLGDAARLEALGVAAKGLGLVLPDTAPKPSTLGLGEQSAGLLVSGDWRVDAGELTRLVQAAQDLGVLLETEPPRAGGHDLLVIATGASRDFQDQAPELASLTPIKGHILRYPTLTYQGPVLRGPGAYAAPGRAGLLVGATMEVGEGPGCAPRLRTECPWSGAQRAPASFWPVGPGGTAGCWRRWWGRSSPPVRWDMSRGRGLRGLIPAASRPEARSANVVSGPLTMSAPFRDHVRPGSQRCGRNRHPARLKRDRGGFHLPDGHGAPGKRL